MDVRNLTAAAVATRRGCRIVEDTVCSQELERKCDSTSSNPQCTTKTETKCRTVQDQICDAAAPAQEVCSIVKDTVVSTKCETVVEPLCSDITEDVLETVCQTVEDEVCQVTCYARARQAFSWILSASLLFRMQPKVMQPVSK